MSGARIPIRGAQPQSSPESQSLPGIGGIMSGLGPQCPRCHHIWQSNELHHHHVCRTTGDEPLSPSSLGPISTAVHHGSNSSAASSPGRRSENPSPASSRSPSIVGPVQGGYASSVDIPDERICSTHGFACSDPEHMRRASKKDKEKGARTDQAQVLQNSEDSFVCYFNWKPGKAQSPGNGNSAGVETPKVDLLRLSHCFALQYLDDELKKAIEAGHEEQWKAETSHKANAYLARFKESEKYVRKGSYDPSFDGSMMEQSDKRRCETAAAKGSKLCTTHPDLGLRHVECRKRHRQTDFEEGRAAVMRAVRCHL